jgi:hypothetical protein
VANESIATKGKLQIKMKTNDTHILEVDLT